jgi:hypothetical protein
MLEVIFHAPMVIPENFVPQSYTICALALIEDACGTHKP